MVCNCRICHEVDEKVCDRVVVVVVDVVVVVVDVVVVVVVVVKPLASPPFRPSGFV